MYNGKHGEQSMFLIFMLAYSHLIPEVVTGDTKQP